MDPHRSIQDIIPPARSRPIRTPPASVPVAEQGSMALPPRPPARSPKLPSGPWHIYGLLVAAVIVIGGIALVVFSTVFHRAYVTVTPYAFSATLSSASFPSSIDSATFPYQSVMATDTVSEEVPATGKVQASDHASGTVVIYNAYSTTAQRLITNTRFQTASGLIFRVHTSVTVPGYTVKAGLKVPGSVEATIYADQAGDSYNMGLSDFTIPGLKGTSQYTLIYAKSKTAMAGGFVGERAVVDATARAQAVKDLDAQLDRSLRAKLLTLIPAGSVAFPDTVSVTFSDVPDTLKDADTATVSVSGTASAPAFTLDTLAHAFGGTAGVDYDGPLTVQNPTDLTVEANPMDAALSGAPLTLNVSGTANLVAVFDAKKLADDLAGKTGKDITTIRSQYPGIDTMEVKVYPFWRAEIPADPSRVTVKVVLPNGVDATR